MNYWFWIDGGSNRNVVILLTVVLEISNKIQCLLFYAIGQNYVAITLGK